MGRYCLIVALTWPLAYGCAEGTSDVVEVGEPDFSAPVLGRRDMQMLPPPPMDAGMDIIPVVDAGDPVGPAMDAAPMGPMGDPACEALADCLSACNTGPCAQMCREMAPAESSARYDAIFACGRDQGCGEPGGGFDDDCMEARCGDALMACYGPPPAPPPPGMGVLTCQELGICLSECVSGDIACRDDCHRSASPEGQTQFTQVGDCVDDCPSGDFACRFNDCREALTACYGPQPPGPMGQGSCGELNNCLAECEQGDAACTGACYSASGTSGFNAFFNLGACIETSGCPAPAQTQCIQAACGDQWGACFGSSPMGMATCAQFNECVSACDGDEACFDQCVAEASVEGYSTWLAAIDCISMAGCAAGDQACVDANCGAEVEACIGPQAMPAGNATCLQFNQCLSVCMGERVCVDNCIAGASPEGYRRLVAVFDCFRANNCQGNDPNCQRLCAPQITACETHR